MDRRTFLGVLSIPALVGLSGGAAAQTSTEGRGYSGVATWLGPIDDRPDPDSFESVSGQVAYIAKDTGEIATATLGADSSWSPLPVRLVGYPQPELPTDLPTGALVFDENRNLPAWFDTDHYEYPNYVDDVLINPVTVANTTARTTVFDPDINANSLVAGRKYQIDLSGVFSTANNSDQFTIDVNLSGATDVAGIGNVGGNATNAPWSIEFAFTVRSHGQTGELQPHTKGLFNGEPIGSDHNVVTVDTTTVTELSVDIQWNAAAADNSVTVKQAHLKQMG